MKNRDALLGTLVMVVVGGVLTISILFGLSAWIGAIVLLPTVVSWPLEFRADRSGGCLSGDPLALASALKRLDDSGFISLLINPFTHPPTKLRVWRLERSTKRTAKFGGDAAC